MPKVNWGISAGDVDNYDRNSQYKPYDGPIPPNGVYLFQVKILKFVAGTGTKNPQLRIGLELTPRSGRKDEKPFTGYFLMEFIPVAGNTQFRYVPFLDALGVSGREFEQGTITDEDGNIKKIGKWRNAGDAIIKAEIRDDTDQNGVPRKKIGWMGAYDPEADESDEEFDDDDEYADDDEDGGWDDE